MAMVAGPADFHHSFKPIKQCGCCSAELALLLFQHGGDRPGVVVRITSRH
jgi:hypothetical protein